MPFNRISVAKISALTALSTLAFASLTTQSASATLAHSDRLQHANLIKVQDVTPEAPEAEKKETDPFEPAKYSLFKIQRKDIVRSKFGNPGQNTIEAVPVGASVKLSVASYHKVPDFSLKKDATLRYSALLKPTIDQLRTDYNNRRHPAQKKTQEPSTFQSSCPMANICFPAQLSPQGELENVDLSLSVDTASAKAAARKLGVDGIRFFPVIKTANALYFSGQYADVDVKSTLDQQVQAQPDPSLFPRAAGADGDLVDSAKLSPGILPFKITIPHHELKNYISSSFFAFPYTDKVKSSDFDVPTLTKDVLPQEINEYVLNAPLYKTQVLFPRAIHQRVEDKPNQDKDLKMVDFSVAANFDEENKSGSQYAANITFNGKDVDDVKALADITPKAFVASGRQTPTLSLKGAIENKNTPIETISTDSLNEKINGTLDDTQDKPTIAVATSTKTGEKLGTFFAQDEVDREKEQNVGENVFLKLFNIPSNIEKPVVLRLKHTNSQDSKDKVEKRNSEEEIKNFCKPSSIPLFPKPNYTTTVHDYLLTPGRQVIKLPERSTTYCAAVTKLDEGNLKEPERVAFYSGFSTSDSSNPTTGVKGALTVPGTCSACFVKSNTRDPEPTDISRTSGGKVLALGYHRATKQIVLDAIIKKKPEVPDAAGAGGAGGGGGGGGGASNTTNNSYKEKAQQPQPPQQQQPAESKTLDVSLPLNAKDVAVVSAPGVAGLIAGLKPRLHDAASCTDGFSKETDVQDSSETYEKKSSNWQQGIETCQKKATETVQEDEDDTSSSKIVIQPRVTNINYFQFLATNLRVAKPEEQDVEFNPITGRFDANLSAKRDEGTPEGLGGTSGDELKADVPLDYIDSVLPYTTGTAGGASKCVNKAMGALVPDYSGNLECFPYLKLAKDQAGDTAASKVATYYASLSQKDKTERLYAEPRIKTQNATPCVDAKDYSSTCGPVAVVLAGVIKTSNVTENDSEGNKIDAELVGLEGTEVKQEGDFYFVWQPGYEKDAKIALGSSDNALNLPYEKSKQEYRVGLSTAGKFVQANDKTPKSAQTTDSQRMGDNNQTSRETKVLQEMIKGDNGTGGSSSQKGYSASFTATRTNINFRFVIGGGDTDNLPKFVVKQGGIPKDFKVAVVPALSSDEQTVYEVSLPWTAKEQKNDKLPLYNPGNTDTQYTIESTPQRGQEPIQITVPYYNDLNLGFDPNKTIQELQFPPKKESEPKNEPELKSVTRILKHIQEEEKPNSETENTDNSEQLEDPKPKEYKLPKGVIFSITGKQLTKKDLPTPSATLPMPQRFPVRFEVEDAVKNAVDLALARACRVRAMGDPSCTPIQKDITSLRAGSYYLSYGNEDKDFGGSFIVSETGAVSSTLLNLPGDPQTKRIESVTAGNTVKAKLPGLANLDFKLVDEFGQPFTPQTKDLSSRYLSSSSKSTLSFPVKEPGYIPHIFNISLSENGRLFIDSAVAKGLKLDLPLVRERFSIPFSLVAKDLSTLSFPVLFTLMSKDGSPLATYSSSATSTAATGNTYTGQGRPIALPVTLPGERIKVAFANKEYSLTVSNTGDVTLGGTPAPKGSVVFGDSPLLPSLPSGSTVTLASSDRYATALQVARHAFSKSDTAVIVSGEGFADALSAGPLAAKLAAPLLLTPSSTLYTQIPGYLESLGAKKVVLVGGLNALSQGVEDALKAKYTVERVSGANRYETSSKIANQYFAESKSAFYASGESFADALSASSAASLLSIPVVLANPQTPQVLQGHTPIFVGGTSVLSNPATLPADSVRLSGADRYATSLLVAQYAQKQNSAAVKSVAFATGSNFPDALVASNLSAKGAVLLLSQSTLSAEANAFVRSLPSGRQVFVIGALGASSSAFLAS